MSYIIYKHTSPSEKSYIGYTQLSIQNRWNEHFSKTIKLNWKFSRALRKYPNEGQWIHEILINNIPTLEEAKNLEILCIFYLIHLFMVITLLLVEMDQDLVLKKLKIKCPKQDLNYIKILNKGKTFQCTKRKIQKYKRKK